MASTSAHTVEEYLAEFSSHRGAVVSRVRDVILENLPLEVMGRVAAAHSVGEFIDGYERARKK